MNNQIIPQNTELPSLVEEIGRIRDNIMGEIIPDAWFKHLRIGKQPDDAACKLLAHIMFRYTPTKVFDEKGNYLYAKKKFRGEYWVIDFNEVAEKKGISDDTVRRALNRLVEQGLVRTEQISIQLNNANGRIYRICVIPIIDKIKNITKDDEGAVIIKKTTDTHNADGILTHNADGHDTHYAYLPQSPLPQNHPSTLAGEDESKKPKFVKEVESKINAIGYVQSLLKKRRIGGSGWSLMCRCAFEQNSPGTAVNLLRAANAFPQDFVYNERTWKADANKLLGTAFKITTNRPSPNLS